MAFSSLVLGDLDLTDYSGLQYGISLIAEGTSRGAPVPVEVAVKSWLQDGSVVVTQGYDNREVSLRVRMQGPDLLNLAEAEAALFAELGKPNLLTWTPPDGYGPPSVFVVVTSSMVESPGPSGDLAEARSYPSRSYNLRLVCEAFVRSETEVTVSALAASGETVTNVDNGSATTNWTGTIDGAAASPSVVSGAVGVTSASVLGTTVLSLTRTASITTSATKYLAISYRPTTGAYVQSGFSQTLAVYADGVALPIIARAVVSGGVYRVTYFVAAASVAVFRADLTVKGNPPGVTNGGVAQVRTFFIDNIDRTDIRPSVGTTRQLARTVDIAGSAPAPGSLSVSHATNALGDALVYVWCDPDNTAALYTPALEQYSIGGGSADTALVSGNRTSLSAGAGHVYDVPASGLPGGRYVMLARCAAQSGSFAGSFTWYAKTRINTTDVDTEQTGTATAAFTTAYTIYPVARLNLPLTDVRDISTATVRVTLKNSSASAIYLDDVWLVNLTRGQLIWVDCGTGTAASGGPSRRLFIDPPTVETPRPVVLRGHAVDGSDAFYANVRAWGQPQFRPEQMNMFTVTTNANDADVAVTYFPRHHTHAAV